MKNLKKIGQWSLMLGWIPTLVLMGYWFMEPGTVKAADSKPVMVSRIYTGVDGKTHAEEYEVPLSPRPGRPHVELGDVIPVESIQFRRTSSDYYVDWHNAPRPQYVITLSGESEVEVEDGTKVRLHPGHILLAEDLTGKGHISRAVGNEARLSIAIPVAK